MCEQCDAIKAFNFDDNQPKPPIISDDLTATVLLLLWDDNQRSMMNIIRREWDSKLTFKESATKQLMDLIAKDAAQAAQLGRQRAGNGGDFGEDDLAFGRAWAMQDQERLNDLIEHVVNGDFGDFEKGYDSPEVQANIKKLEQRNRLRANGLIGVANEAFAQSLPEDEKIWWMLSKFEKHCADCPRIAAASPYTRKTLRQHPKDGSTQCITNCLCWLRTESGKQSFVPLPVGVAKPELILH